MVVFIGAEGDSTEKKKEGEGVGSGAPRGGEREGGPTRPAGNAWMTVARSRRARACFGLVDRYSAAGGQMSLNWLQNSNDSIHFKIFPNLTDPKSTFPCLKILK
jgi:hypothetical protein